MAAKLSGWRSAQRPEIASITGARVVIDVHEVAGGLGFRQMMDAMQRSWSVAELSPLPAGAAGPS